MQVVGLFQLLGRAMAKALQDNRLLDLPLSYVFYRCAPWSPIPCLPGPVQDHAGSTGFC